MTGAQASSKHQTTYSCRVRHTCEERHSRCACQGRPVLVFGHRGSRSPGPDNSVAAVSGALSAGADGVEVDLRRASDGRLVLCHDAVVRGRPVRTQTPRELAEGGVPLLTEVLTACRGRGRVVCEVKNSPGEPDHDPSAGLTLAALLSVLEPADDVVVSSFDARVAAAAGGAGVRSALLTRPGTTVGAGVAAALAGGQAELHAHVSSARVDRSAPRRAHDAGLSLVVWTVSRLTQARRLMSAGADGVIADDPAAVVADLRRGQARDG